MSEQNETTPVINVAPAEEHVETPVKFPRLNKYVVTPIKKHPKIAIAVAAGAALVVGAAVAGSSEEQDEETYEPSEESMEYAEAYLNELGIDTPVEA